MFFSIIIPLYNAKSTICDTLDSVLSQTYRNYEIIIINDCSTDNSSEIIEKYKSNYSNITVINNEANIGVSNSRNKGFSIARGEYIALIDSDDIWHNKKLELQKEIIDTTNCDICATSYGFINENGKIIKKNYIIPDKISYDLLLKENFIGCSSVVLRKDILNYYKMDPKFSHEDYALWLTLARNNYKIVGTNQVLMYYRILQNSRSSNKLKAAINRFKIYRVQEHMNIYKSLYYLFCYFINSIKKRLL